MGHGGTRRLFGYRCILDIDADAEYVSRAWATGRTCVCVVNGIPGKPVRGHDQRH